MPTLYNRLAQRLQREQRDRRAQARTRRRRSISRAMWQLTQWAIVMFTTAVVLGILDGGGFAR